MTSLGYVLGRTLGSVAGVDRYFMLLVLAFFIIPGLPTVIHLWRHRRHEIAAAIKGFFARRRG
jgi:hypothetical protein